MATPVIREIKEGLQKQGEAEVIAYTLTTTPWGGSPSSEDASIWEVVAGIFTDVTADKMTGSASVNGDVITLPPIKELASVSMYRVFVDFTISGNKFRAYARLEGEL